MQPNPLTCPDCGKPFDRAKIAAHLIRHNWSQASIEAFILSGTCRMAKAAPIPRKQLYRSAHV